jgi:hypothetical protein
MRLLFTTPTAARVSVVALAGSFFCVVGAAMVGCSQSSVPLPLYDGGPSEDATLTDASDSDGSSEACACDASLEGAATDGASDASTDGSSKSDGGSSDAGGDGASTVSDAGEEGGG